MEKLLVSHHRRGLKNVAIYQLQLSQSH